ncbi:hypothetical protein CP082626L3_0810A, partial [Chlamydia psittaci 08-2626_L3]|jgi:hypothetical protein
MSLVP